MSYKFILTEAKGHVLKITLNRPEKLNAISPDLRRELVDAVLQGEADNDVHALVIKGAGRAFSSGYDISPASPDRRTPYEVLNIREDIQNMQRLVADWALIWNLSKPVVAQVHGYCLAGGSDLALHCDMIIAAEDAQIGFPAVRALGAPPTHMWTYMVGPQWAKYFLLTGNLISGKEAERIGLVLKAVPAARLEQEADDLTALLAKIDKDMLAANKSIVNKAVELMGRSMLQQLAAENDAIAHKAPVVAEFHRIAREKGVKAALEWRDGKFRE